MDSGVRVSLSLSLSLSFLTVFDNGLVLCAAAERKKVQVRHCSAPARPAVRATAGDACATTIKTTAGVIRRRLMQLSIKRRPRFSDLPAPPLLLPSESSAPSSAAPSAEVASLVEESREQAVRLKPHHSLGQLALGVAYGHKAWRLELFSIHLCLYLYARRTSRWRWEGQEPVSKHTYIRFAHSIRQRASECALVCNVFSPSLLFPCLLTCTVTSPVPLCLQLYVSTKSASSPAVIFPPSAKLPLSLGFMMPLGAKTTGGPMTMLDLTLADVDRKNCRTARGERERERIGAALVSAITICPLPGTFFFSPPPLASVPTCVYFLSVLTVFIAFGSCALMTNSFCTTPSLTTLGLGPMTFFFSRLVETCDLRTTRRSKKGLVLSVELRCQSAPWFLLFIYTFRPAAARRHPLRRS